jgi:hypothetical protein
LLAAFVSIAFVRASGRPEPNDPARMDGT